MVSGVVVIVCCISTTTAIIDLQTDELPVEVAELGQRIGRGDLADLQGDPNQDPRGGRPQPRCSRGPDPGVVLYSSKRTSPLLLTWSTWEQVSSLVLPAGVAARDDAAPGVS